MPEYTEEQIERAKRLDDLAGRIFYVVAEHGGYAEGGSEVVLDFDDVLEALMNVSAMLVEYKPNLKTNRDLRLACEELSSKLNGKAKWARAQTERTGKHPIEVYGITQSFAVPIDQTKN